MGLWQRGDYHCKMENIGTMSYSMFSKVKQKRFSFIRRSKQDWREQGMGK